MARLIDGNEKVQIAKIKELLNDAKALREFLSPGELDALSADVSDDPLDKPPMKRLHEKLLGWWENEKRLQAVNRYQMALDEDYYDSIQWNDEDAQKVIERGQAPLVYNLIKPAVNWILGTERRTRVDYRVRPREEDDIDGANTKTKVLKYLSDCNNTPFYRSQSFKDCVVAGVGWLEDTISTSPDEELIYSGYESWRNIWPDSQSRDLTQRDQRYLFRTKWLDLDISAAIWPRHAAMLERSSRSEEEATQEDEELYYMGQRLSSEQGEPRLTPYTTTNSMAGVTEEHSRERVRVIEAWYRVPERAPVIRYRGRTVLYDATDAGQQALVASGRSFPYEIPVMKMRVAIMTEEGLLWEGASPFKHNNFPFTPIVCYRRARDGAFYGVVRDLRSAQEDYNKRMSKALHIMATRQAILEDGATEDVDGLREELAAPDGILEVTKLDKIKIVENQPLIREQVAFAQIDETHISKASGVVDELMGRATNAVSGEAIKSRQLQGSVVTALIFDNFRLAFQLQGEKQLSLAEQYMTEERVIRLAGAKRDQFIVINQPVEQADGSIRYLNDITARKADFVVDAQDYSATIRQALFDSMMELLTKFQPEIAVRLLPMVLEMVDLPNKDEMVHEVRRALGVPDPAAEMTPEEQQEQEQAQQLQQTVQQMQLEATALANKKLEAEINEINANAQAALANLNETPGNQEAEGLKTQIQQLQQQSFQIQTDLKAQIAKLSQDAIQKRDEAELKYAMEVELAEKKAEIERERMQHEDDRDARRLEAERASKRELAEIDASTKAGIAEAQGASEKALAALSEEIKKLTERIEEVRKETEQKQKHAEEMRRAEEKGRSHAQTQTSTSAPTAPAAPPITVNVEAHVEARSKPKTLRVTKGKDGEYLVNTGEEPEPKQGD